MNLEDLLTDRPDTNGLPPEVTAYIEQLETYICSQEESGASTRSRSTRAETPLEPSEPPTTINIISISQGGMAKRTPRHLYGRQRRGGMGVFDLETDEGDPPHFVVAADEATSVILVTSKARAFRVPVTKIAETAIRGRGTSLLETFPLQAEETLALVFPDRGGSYLALASERGQVRRIASHYFGENLQSGTVLYDTADGGPPAAACWTPGDGDLFLATRQGRGIRFSERQVPVRGCLGMRVDPEDSIVGAAAVTESDGVFLVNEEGKGTIRLMSGFSANKSPGAGGKVAMKTDSLVGAVPAAELADIFIISELSKIIRFSLEEVPPKEGVVQGVNCINLRSDRCVGMTTGGVAT